MLTIKKEDNTSEILKEMEIEPNDDFEVMVMRDGGELLGIGIMRIYEKYVSLEKIVLKNNEKDFNLEYGLAKAMLNFIDLHGYRCAVSNNSDDARLLKALRFKERSEYAQDFDDVESDWLYCLNLDGYFSSNC